MKGRIISMNQKEKDMIILISIEMKYGDGIHWT